MASGSGVAAPLTPPYTYRAWESGAAATPGSAPSCRMGTITAAWEARHGGTSPLVVKAFHCSADVSNVVISLRAGGKERASRNGL
jgi:hypothetical protein